MADKYPIQPEDQEYLDRAFGYHKPTENQLPRFERINRTSRELAAAILGCCPPSPERNLALREVELARMRANQAIAINEAGLVEQSPPPPDEKARLSGGGAPPLQPAAPPVTGAEPKNPPAATANEPGGAAAKTDEPPPA